MTIVELLIINTGTKWWYRSDRRHRLDGPAIVRPDGFQCWFWNGLRHRLDGPAVICPDGTIEYWLNGNPVSEYEHMFLTEATYG